MKAKIIIDELVNRILSGDRKALAQGITLVESELLESKSLSQELFRKLSNDPKQSIRIGITGAPGSGKSTFIDAIGSWLVSLGNKVAVLAIDPSSEISGGSILGDRTRMENLGKLEHAFVRASPASGHLGGINRKTWESIRLCEAAGYDYIFIETVGVGQSETEVRWVSDVVIFLALPGSGDSLQGIKRGIMEVADLIAVNKCDGDMVKAGREKARQLLQIIALIPHSLKNWKRPVLQISSIQDSAFDTILEHVNKLISLQNRK